MKKKLTLLLIIALLATMLCGCGGAAKSESAAAGESYFAENDMAVMAPAAPAEPMAPMAPTVSDSAMSAGGWNAPMEPVEPEEAPMPEPETQQSTGLPENVKLIYRANIELESTEFDNALAGLNELVTKLGGYFESSRLDNYSSYRYGNYTVRVPAKNFETFCTSVGELCQVNSISRSAEDVSEHYYDTESRLTTQKTKLARLQELLKQAEDMEDIITLESAISDTELTIEHLTGTLRKYDSLVGYSTVNISLNEVYKLTEVEQPVIGFGAKLAAAFKTGCTRFARNFEDFLLGFARGWVGWLLFIIVVAVVVMLARRSARRKRSGASGEKRCFLKRRKAGREEVEAPADKSERGE